ncbi:MAG TPA: toll/interleukin-1 receptor domain-containing protein [Nitrospira sp.]|nr:toll/interleukin-1 receptor domain-containing protein [Nitrospira sp.]
MKIFLSYAHEQRLIAEEINVALSVQGHEVFFDRSALTPGKEYDSPIQKAIDACDLVVFLISPASVRKEHYAQSELLFAKKRWPSPSGKILPVMAQPTLLPKVDPYLRAVTILYPQGNIATEVATAVNALSERKGSESMDAPLTSDIQRERIIAYKELWKVTEVLPKWPRLESVRYEALAELSKSLRNWYFTDGGGMFLSRSAHTSYAALQDSLTAILSEHPSGVITDEHYDAIRELCSALRSRLTHDVGSRN